MKIRRKITSALLLAAFLTGGSAVYAASGADIKKEAGETVSVIKEYSIEQKDAAVAKANELMDTLDDNAHVWEGRIKEKWDSLKDSSHDSFNTTSAKIKQQRAELAEWAEKLRNSSGDAWDEAKEGFDKAYEALKESLSKAADEMK